MISNHPVLVPVITQFSLQIVLSHWDTILRNSCELLMTGVSAAVAAASSLNPRGCNSELKLYRDGKAWGFPSSNQFWGCCGCESGVHIWKSICVDVHHFFYILLMNIGGFLLEEYPLSKQKPRCRNQGINKGFRLQSSGDGDRARVSWHFHFWNFPSPLGLGHYL